MIDEIVRKIYEEDQRYRECVDYCMDIHCITEKWRQDWRSKEPLSNTLKNSYKKEKR